MHFNIKAMTEEQYINFDEYIRQGEPQKKARADAWRVAIGLQAVDGLKTSAYLQETARRNIEGDITIDEAKELVNQYYIKKTTHEEGDANVEEADKVSTNISKLLQTDSFTYSVAGFAAIHRAIFNGVFKHAGRFRDYDITKKEWVLRGDTVFYAHWEDLQMTLEYDLEQERQFDYKSLEKDQLVEHIARFVSGLWQIHPFGEGNTRTTAIFTIKYLRSIGFQNIDNTLFEQHSWYFRNALVRANYKNLAKNVNPDISYLEAFFRNLLLKEQMPLSNRDLQIGITNAPNKYRTSTEQVPNKYRTSIDNLLPVDDENTICLLQAIEHEKLSIKEIMGKMGLKHRPTFMDNYLNPAIENGFVRLLYPDSPRHPRQKYLLTVKGMMLYNQLSNK